MDPKRKTLSAIESFVKAFEGDVYGPYVWQKMRQEKDVTHMDVRLNQEVFWLFHNVVSINFHIKSMTTVGLYNTLTLQRKESLSRGPEVSRDRWVTVTVMCGTSAMLMIKSADFDVNCLVETSVSMFVKPMLVASSIHTFDKLHMIRERIEQRRFALVGAPLSVQDGIVNMMEAEHMVKGGWIMDDTHLQDGSWIVNLWKNYSTGEKKSNRLYQSDREQEQMMHQNFCSLCHDTFHEEDVVFNSCCNHNFHMRCTPSKTEGGILYWFRLKNECACPICRGQAVMMLGNDGRVGGGLGAGANNNNNNTNNTTVAGIFLSAAASSSASVSSPTPTPPPPPPPPPHPHRTNRRLFA
jgi:hypothetical protein